MSDIDPSSTTTTQKRQKLDTQSTTTTFTMAKFDDQDPKKSTASLETPYVKLFSSPTSNGRKITIFFELLGIDYIYRETDYKYETKEPWYLKINPNGKVPAIIDVDKNGEVLKLAESGALLLYLAEKYDTKHQYSYATSSPLHWEETEFLFFHASGLSVAQTKYNGDKSADNLAALLKQYQLVEDQLAQNGSGYLVGDHISLADVIALAHAVQFKESADTSKLPHFNKWVETLSALPAVKAAYNKK